MSTALLPEAPQARKGSGLGMLQAHKALVLLLMVVPLANCAAGSEQLRQAWMASEEAVALYEAGEYARAEPLFSVRSLEPSKTRALQPPNEGCFSAVRQPTDFMHHFPPRWLHQFRGTCSAHEANSEKPNTHFCCTGAPYDGSP
jgi:hypothetical protein